MYPSKAKAYAGIFVKNQFEEVKSQLEAGNELEIFFMKRSFTGKLGSLMKYLAAFVKFVPHLFKKHDIVHVHYFYPLILLAWAKKKIWKRTKIVVTFLGRDINSQVNESNRKFYKKIARSVDYSIPVGKTMADEVERKLGLTKIKILPCGVNSKIFYKEEGSEKKYDFIFLGSFIHRKGIDTVIEAIRKLPQDENIKFCFCGSGDYLEDLKSLQKDYDVEIKQNQTQPQLRTLLNESRFFLLMSRAEGFATATTEAFFCHVPVVTSDIDNFKEQVEEGENGFIVPLGDSDALTEKLKELSKIKVEEYEKLVKGASVSFKEAALSTVCSEIIGIYKELHVAG